MPWQPEEEELVLQNQYMSKASNNFESELRSINKEIKLEKEF